MFPVNELGIEFWIWVMAMGLIAATLIATLVYFKRR